MTQSAYFPYGQHDVSQTITSVGHSSFLTGAYPYQTGVPLNIWYSREKQKIIRSVEDDDSFYVGIQSKTFTEGTSPKNLNATNLGDELKNAGYPSRTIAIALKERAAVLMGGHRADLATWYHPASHQWISSRYYLPAGELPEWIKKLNAELKPELNKEIRWNAEGNGTGYSAQDSMAKNDMTNAAQLGGMTFPHTYKIGTDAVLATPLGVKLTRQAAEQALTANRLGQNETTDILAISFSSHDILGHMFGLNSREMEELTVCEDREISHLLNFVKKNVPNGLKDVVFVLTGDHGVAPVPELATSHKLEAGRMSGQDLADQISEHLRKLHPKADSSLEWIHTSIAFNIYINYETLKKLNLDQAEVEKEIKQFLLQDPRYAFVSTSSELARGIYPPGIHRSQMMHTFVRGRSGDVLIIPKPYYISDSKKDSASHISGYSYDRSVPILFSGRHFKKKIFSSRAEFIDIAPTLSFISGVIAPNLSEGRVLSEVLAD